MNASNIFKMEFYKNFRDRAWLIIIGCIAAVALLITIITIALIKSAEARYASVNSSGIVLLIALLTFLIIFGFIGYYAFAIIYPFRLLSSDYSAGTMGLMIASGVKRTTYYFVKIVATILTTLLAQLAIWILPVVLVFGFYGNEVMNALSEVVKNVNFGNFALLGLSAIISLIATNVALFFWVILFKGKFWTIFVYFGVSMVFGIFTQTIYTTLLTGSSYALTSSSNVFYSSIISQASGIAIFFSVVQIVLFGLLGYFRIKKQDL
jgi:ABC-type transport system involved in multi-copper enzyme maturation permease subunit